MSGQYFTEEAFEFLSALAVNNERAWFKANKKRYESAIREPFQRLLSDLAEPIKQISPEFVASPKTVGGSLFRIHRDTRFSNNKTPYKTHAGAVIFHQLKGQPAPCFYLHISPSECFFGGGIYHPPSPTLRAIRDFLVDNPKSWERARDRVIANGMRFGGDSLIRPPRGFAADHPLIEDLKRKSFVVSTEISHEQVLSDQFPDWFINQAEQTAPLVDYLCAALDLPF